jgi:signal transduction histidine kinase
LREVSEIAQRMLEHVRGLSQTLHPSILEEVGFEGTLDWYLSTVERQTGVAISYDRTTPSAPIDGTVAIHVYRIMQEALNNVVRHSGANQASVRLRVTAGLLELDIEDHGAGMNGGTPRRGLGIVTMRERAALVGGTIEFVRPREGGTLVRVRVPIISVQHLDDVARAR